ncbi:hypothetical protein NRS6108_04606 [Bacillus subtilis]|nr:hypothetical protein NRS6108_04606 [Bacillus subtilis]
MLALRHQGEVDHHDRVLLDDADQQNQRDHRDHRQFGVGAEQRQQRTDARRRQRGQDGDRVDQALVEHAQHQVDGQDRGKHQDQHVAGI